MYSTINHHKSHVWLAENISSHRADALALKHSKTQAVSFRGKADASQGKSCHCAAWTQRALLGLIMLLAYFSKYAPHYFLREKSQMADKISLQLCTLFFRGSAEESKSSGCFKTDWLYYYYVRAYLWREKLDTSCWQNKWRCRSMAMFLNQCKESVTTMEINIECKKWDSLCNRSVRVRRGSLIGLLFLFS